ncbi:MAG: plasmid pRiA4b ORF-3 family protein [Candidatus Lambdaproteobacteria bacterium]|nr:plasmid pRiA4b ORF-3 family protein [Candidatus Lambdaproteobacteria bacterium]
MAQRKPKKPRKVWMPPTPRAPRKATARPSVKDPRLFTLEVLLINGPVTEEFIQQNPKVTRTIQLRGDQTLEALHWAIYEAFDRDDEHMYEFQVGGKRPHDRKARRYILSLGKGDFFFEDEADGTVTRTTIGALGLKARGVFFYWFDFGDDWWHKLKVVSIADEAPKGKYPKLTARVGESPPQYPDWDDEDEDYDDDEDEAEEENDREG